MYECTKNCFDCVKCLGRSPDTTGRILCKDKECALYYGNIEEWEEEHNHELVPPGFWGLSCNWFEVRK